MRQRIRVIIVEDEPDDAELMVLALRRGGLDAEWERVETGTALTAALAAGPWDAVLSDHTMPEFGSAAALAIVREGDPDLPFIVVSGTVGEDAAVAMMRAGANDYILKGSLVRLPPVIEREVREVGNRRAKRATELIAAQLASIVQSSDDAITSMTPDGIIVSWNPAAERLHGLTAAEAVGRPISIIVPPEKADEFVGLLDRMRRGEHLTQFETVRLHRDGTRRHVSVTAAPILDQDGQLVGVSKFARDIGDRIRREEELRASEDRFRQQSQVLQSILDNMSDGVVAADETGQFLLFNPAAEHILRSKKLDARPEEWQAQYSLFLPPDGVLPFPTADNPMVKAMRGEACDAVEMIVNHDRSPDPRWISVNARPMRDAAGGLRGGITVFRNITEQKRAEIATRRSEQRYRSLVEATAAIVWDSPPSGEFDTEQAGWSAFTGQTVEQHRGWGWLNAIHPDDRPKSARAWAVAVQERTPYQLDHRVLRADGQVRLMSARAVPVCGPAGEIREWVGVHTDVTDQKLAEEAVRASEERLRSFVENVSAPVAMFDREMRYLHVSRRWMTDYHLGERNIIGLSHYEVFPELPPSWKEIHQRCLAGAVDRCEEASFERADGTVQWIRWEVRPWVRTGGGFGGVIMFTEDITSRKRAETLLLESQQRLVLATESAGIGIWDWDVSANAMAWDARMLVLYGIRRHEFTGGYDQWQNGLHPDDRGRAGAEIATALAGTKDFHTEFRIVRGDGEVRHIEAHALVQRAADGSATRMTGVNWDITDRKRAEDALRLRDRAIQAATQGLLITDPSQAGNPIIYVSPGFERITGYASAESVGRNCRFLQGVDTSPAAVAQIHAAVRAEEPCTVELLNYRKDGTPFWNELSVAPVRNAAGDLMHFVGVQSDVTHRRKLEEQFRQAQKLDAFGQLAGGVAHDFNNLLTIINGYSEVLLQKLPAGDSSRELVAEIHKAGERSAGLTRQLLAFSRKQVLAPRILNLNEVVAETDKMLRRMIGEDVRLTTTLESAPWAVRADAGLIEQVLLNLAVNARDAMPMGGRLTIETQNIELNESYTRTHADARAGPHVLLSMTDTGTGMSPDVQERIFEPFFTTKDPGKGTGLGLATVFGIVKQSGGHVAVYSEVGVGTSFKVYLPRVEPRSDVREAPTRIVPPPRGTETILLAEDEAGVRGLTSYILAGCGYTVFEAADGTAAVQIADGHRGPIHLLVTDVVMPGAGGRSVSEQVAKRHPGVRVLFTSGYTDDAVIRHGVLREGVNFLQKPFSPTALAFKVREVLDAPAETDRLS
ncbi:PAS domain S-box protein [Limnoglobus roseus]|uniref:histidine kinase n=1 Tax=Limnoglobus roseus TaxID=2598579 RepID=A0A5C1AIM8_9BACT|nr:PAS domain S-box protein [Limnoglobus roseus]QEL16828.1 putative diguanylate cyclase/histidine kinase [Limnoglobus roseus]